MSLLASGFRVEHLGSGGLVVVNPPIMWASILCYGLAGIGLLMLAAGVISRTRSTGIIGVFMLLVFTGGGWAMSVPSTATLNRDAGMMTVHIGWAHATSTYPLEQVKYATVESTTAAYRLVFVLDDGSRVGLGSYSDQSGQPEAAHAVNEFLGVDDSRP